MHDKPIRYHRGSATDSSSSGQNGTISGTITTGQAGLLPNGDPQTSINFNATGYISMPTTGLPSGANPWSMEAWVKWPSSSGLSFDTWMNIGSNVALEQGAPYLDTGVNSLNLGLGSGNNVVSNQGMTAGTVYYTVGSYDGTTGIIDIFWSGGHVNVSHAYSVNIIYGIARFGTDVTNSFPFHGFGQEFAIYNYALSPDQRRTHYYAGLWTPNRHRSIGRVF